MDLTNKVAILTGGAEGIGKATCIKLLEKGVKVCFCDINGVLGEKTNTEFQNKFGQDKVTFVECDITDEEKLECVFKRAIEKFGVIDIVVNNAGVMLEGPRWRKTIGVNLIALIESCKKAEMYMSRHHGGKGGVIVNIASIEGIRATHPFPVYTASKWGNVGFTKCMADMSDKMQTGIRYACLCPDGTDTSLVRQVLSDNGITESDFPFLSPEAIGDGVIRLLEKEDENGAVATITMKDGVDPTFQRCSKILHKL